MKKQQRKKHHTRKILRDKNLLTSSQKDILFTIMKEYFISGEILGSVKLVRKYGGEIDYCIASVKNQCILLRQLDYMIVKKRWTKNQPTKKSFDIYFDYLYKKIQVEIKKIRDLKIEIARFDGKNFEKDLLRLISQKTECISFFINQDKELYFGLKNLVKIKNLGEANLEKITNFLDNLDIYKEYLLKKDKKNGKYIDDFQIIFDDDYTIRIGEDLGILKVKTKFGGLGIIGSKMILGNLEKIKVLKALGGILK